MASYESGLRLGVRRARQRLAAERPEDDARLRDLFRRDVAALRFGRHDRLDDLLEWLGVEAHEPLRVGAPGARVFVLGGAADDKRPTVEEARAFVAEGRALITSADCVAFAAEVAPELRPKKPAGAEPAKVSRFEAVFSGKVEPTEASAWSKPASGWGGEEAGPAVAGPVEAPRLAWALGELEPAWVDSEHTFGGEGWVTRGGEAVAASVAIGEGHLVHLGGALLSWSPPEKGEAVDPATLGIADGDGSPVDERAFRIGVTAGALLLEAILAAQ